MQAKKPIVAVVFSPDGLRTAEASNAFTAYADRMTELGGIPLLLPVGDLATSKVTRLKDYIQISTVVLVFHEDQCLDNYLPTIEAICNDSRTPIVHNFPVSKDGTTEMPMPIEKLITMYTLVVNAKHNSVKREEAIEEFERAEDLKYGRVYRAAKEG